MMKKRVMAARDGSWSEACSVTTDPLQALNESQHRNIAAAGIQLLVAETLETYIVDQAICTYLSYYIIKCFGVENRHIKAQPFVRSR